MTTYRIDDYATTATATDITPTGDFNPDYPYALFCDPTAYGAVTMVADDGTDQHWYTSSDYGATWADEGETSYTYRVAKMAASAVILAGASALVFSDNGGADFADKAGDWDSGTIKGFWVVI